jgi:outer membrane protein assembly factor BamD
MIKRIIIIILCSLLVFSCSNNKKTDELAGFTPEQLYRDGMKKLHAGSYKEALKYFDRISQEYPYSPLASRAQLMESYAYYRSGKFEYAIAALDDYISLYPGEKSVEYAYYLKSLCYYDQIVDIKFDQNITELTKVALTDVINRFPDSDYARDARFKLSLVLDHLAGKEMEIGRFYIKQGNIISAINRFQTVIEQYQTTTHIQEALYRAVECYHILGVKAEAKKYAAVLGSNYPQSKWYRYSYNLIIGKDATTSQD